MMVTLELADGAETTRAMLDWLRASGVNYMIHDDGSDLTPALKKELEAKYAATEHS